MTEETFVRITEWEAAFDKRDPDPKKNFGIHGVEMRWILKGAKGAVQFLVYTNWHLPNVTEEQAEQMQFAADKAMELRCFWRPMAADLGYHSKFPMYEGQAPMGSVRTQISQDAAKVGFEKFQIESTATGTFTPCPYLDGGPCYYDGSGLHAEKVLEMLIAKGGEAVWKYMEECYHETFDSMPCEVRA